MSTSGYATFVYVERALGVFQGAQCLFAPAAAAAVLTGTMGKAGAAETTSLAILVIQWFGLVFLFMHVCSHAMYQNAMTPQHRRDIAAVGAVLWSIAIAFNVTVALPFASSLNTYFDIGMGGFFVACHVWRYLSLSDGAVKKA